MDIVIDDCGDPQANAINPESLRPMMASAEMPSSMLVMFPRCAFRGVAEGDVAEMVADFDSIGPDSGQIRVSQLYRVSRNRLTRYHLNVETFGFPQQPVSTAAMSIRLSVTKTDLPLRVEAHFLTHLYRSLVELAVPDPVSVTYSYLRSIKAPKQASPGPDLSRWSADTVKQLAFTAAKLEAQSVPRRWVIESTITEGLDQFIPGLHPAVR